MATPLATIGISKMTDERVVLDGFKHGVGPRSGLYFFPWVDPADPKMMEKHTALVQREPSGILVYHPAGANPDMTPMLIKEFVKQFAQALIAALLLSLTSLGGYWARAGFVTALGIFAGLGSDTSYWIWYGFPLDYTLAQIAILIGEALAAGLVIAAMVKPRRLGVAL
jgi:hypothetical protein